MLFGRLVNGGRVTIDLDEHDKIKLVETPEEAAVSRQQRPGAAVMKTAPNGAVFTSARHRWARRRQAPTRGARPHLDPGHSRPYARRDGR